MRRSRSRRCPGPHSRARRSCGCSAPRATPPCGRLIARQSAPAPAPAPAPVARARSRRRRACGRFAAFSDDVQGQDRGAQDRGGRRTRPRRAPPRRRPRRSATRRSRRITRRCSRSPAGRARTCRRARSSTAISTAPTSPPTRRSRRSASSRPASRGWSSCSARCTTRARPPSGRPANTGVFPDTYDAAIGGGAQPWCTKFAGYAYTRLGFQANKKGTTSEFMSGYRLRDWSAEGEGVDNKEITAADQTVEDAGRHRQRADRQGGVGVAAQGPQEGQDRRGADRRDDGVLRRRRAPDAGRPATSSSSHAATPRAPTSSRPARATRCWSRASTPAAFKIHTIEGNVGDKVGGRTIDLTSAARRLEDHLPHPHGHAVLRQGPRPPRAARVRAGTSTDGGPGLLGDVVSAVLSVLDTARAADRRRARGQRAAGRDQRRPGLDPVDLLAADASVTDWTGATGSGNES